MASSKGSVFCTSATRFRLAVAKAVNSSPCSSAFFAARRAVGLKSATRSTRGSALGGRALYTVCGSSSASGAGGRRLRLISLRGRGSSTGEVPRPPARCAGGLVKIAWMISWLMAGSGGATSGSEAAGIGLAAGCAAGCLPTTGAKRRVSCAGSSASCGAR